MGDNLGDNLGEGGTDFSTLNSVLKLHVLHFYIFSFF